MAPVLARVAIDSCSAIDAALGPEPRASQTIFKLSAAGAIEIVLIDDAESEMRRRLGDELEPLLCGCLIARFSPPVPKVPSQEVQKLLSLLHHNADVPIAAAVAHAKPDFFVTFNLRHWNRRVSDYLGVRIVTPMQLLQELGVPVPPRPRRIR